MGTTLIRIIKNDSNLWFCQSQFWGFSRLSDKLSKILLEIRAIVMLVVKSDYRVQQRNLIDKYSDNTFENEDVGI